MVVRRIGVFSLGKVLGPVYAVLGLIIAIIVTPFLWVLYLIGASETGSSDALGGALFGVVFTILYIIFLPILYGVLGFVFGLLTAWIYNGVARLIGGVEIELEEVRRPGLASGPASDSASGPTFSP